ncbi:MAG TPA: PKD domain-containing protein, partial [Thermoanaerobaculia bacterium]|nr:PKD domain-containing protein [Thermoanaerobaculia bacterium]
VAASAQCVSGTTTVSVRSSFPNRAANAVAWNGTALAVAKTENVLTHPIYVSLYSDALGRLTDDVQVAPGSNNGPLALLWNGTEFGLFYQNQNLRLVLQRISAEGQPIGSGVIVAPARPVFAADEFDITWDAHRQAYAIARVAAQGPDRGLWFWSVRPDGTIAAELQLYFFLATPAHPHIAVTANGTTGIIFDHSAGGIYYIAIAPDNTFTLAQLLPTIGHDARLAVRGNTFAIASTAVTNAGNAIRWLRFNANGTALAPESTIFVSPREVSLSSLIATDREWALAYNDAPTGTPEYRLRRFEDDGTIISDAVFSPDHLTTSLSTRYPFVWTGTSYISPVALFVNNTQGSDSYLIRNCPLRGTPVPNATLVAILDTVQFTADVSGGKPAYKYFWDFGDFSTPSTFEAPTHKYDRTGTYTVTLTVVDAVGATSVETATVRVIREKRRVVRK